MLRNKRDVKIYNLQNNSYFSKIKQGVKHTLKSNTSYFVTLTVTGWIDVFTRINHKNTIIDSLKYCIANKGLNVYAYCLMTNHLHMIVNCNEPFVLKNTIRDLKKFTSQKIIEQIENEHESRREWMLSIFATAAYNSPKHKKYKFWQTGSHAIELYSEKFVWDKINYIHDNPVRAKFVSKPEVWIYSSASNYQNQESILNEVIVIPQQLITYT